ncbi:DUF2073 domain-containing protein [Candidatus Woesearchaeota archaeon]|nr:DUF2073 domain-containing protein [Candidatus Woesearchaeota archaeon]
MITLQFVPYNELNRLTPLGRIKKILDIVKENKIVLVEGRLKPSEEAELIQRTMEEVNREFKGIELCTIYPENKNDDAINKLKATMIDLLIGNRRGLTVIGPATIVKEIKRDPNKIQLLTNNMKKRRRR